MSFGCAIDAGAHLGSFCESDVGFRSAEVQSGSSTNAPESPPESAEPHDSGTEMQPSQPVCDNRDYTHGFR